MMALLLSFAGLANAQDVVEIGTGTNMSNVGPYNSIWGYTFSETLYPAAEIGTAGTITRIAYNVTSSESIHTDVVFYMKNVSRTEFASAYDVETVTP